ncbi:hypothetical protein WA158_001170 [Blastocystis sp. Blastoise]
MTNIVINHKSGACVKIALNGATVISWKLPNGREQLYLSKKNTFENGSAIRGGIPVVFPQFSNEGPLKKHGFARNSQWNCVDTSYDDVRDVATATLALSDNEETRKEWNYKFQLHYIVELSNSSLTTKLVIENTDDKPFDFQALLHTYYSIDNIDDIAITGFKGVERDDKVNHQVYTETHDQINFSSEYDSKYAHPPNDVELIEKNQIRKIHKEFICDGQEIPSDFVVWNIFTRIASIGDMEPEDYKSYVCIEPGYVMKHFTLPANKICSLSQTIHA